MRANRSQACRFIEEQLSGARKTMREKNLHSHYGVQELRDLLDFIYGSPANHADSLYAPGTHRDLLRRSVVAITGEEHEELRREIKVKLREPR